RQDAGEVRVEPVRVGVLAGLVAQGGDHLVDRLGEVGDLAGGLEVDGLGEVASGHGVGDVRDGAQLECEGRGERVHVAGEGEPGAGDAGDLGLAAEVAFDADLAGDARDLGGEAGELLDHG
ncbi:hypothetical protein ADL26_16895, partial [Thermoactinomyces vulgaris]